MPPKRPRKPVVGLAAALFLVTSLNSTPSVPSVPDPLPELPSPEEVAAIEELASWLTGSGDGALHAMSAGDLRAVIRNRPRTFELFRRYNGKEARRRYLQAFPYGEDIFAIAQRYQLDSLLLAALVETESGFASDVVSPRGAMGLMQVLPSTGSSLGGGDLLDPRINLDVGAHYLTDLLELYDGDLELALAAYNAGPGNVERYGGVPPFGETRGYVARVLSRYVENHRDVWDESGTVELFELR